MVIGRLEVGNFKAFRDMQSVPLRPITLIFGANSSGKSSLLHALLLLRHGVEAGDWDAYRTGLGGDSVDLGGFENFVHRHELDEPAHLGVLVEEGTSEVITADPTDASVDSGARRFERLGISLELGVPEARDVSVQSGPGPTRLTVSSGGITFLDAVRSARSDGIYGCFDLREVGLRAPFLADVIDDVANKGTIRIDGDLVDGLDLIAYLDKKDAIRPWVEALRETVLEELSRLCFDRRLRSPVDDQVALAHVLALSNRYEQPFSMESESYWLPDLLALAVMQAASMVRPILLSALERLDYLGPLRAYPQRHLNPTADPETFREAGGAHAWQTMLRNAEVRQQVNAWLGSDFLRTGYRFRERVQYAHEDIEQTFDAMAGRPDESFSDALQRVPPSSRDLVLEDLRSGTRVSHRDIGVGVSQVLPVLVSAFGSQRRQIMIEQPELHLHPGLQAELGDVFIRSATGDAGNRFVIETHSEHLILRVLRRIRETSEGVLLDDALALRPEDVSVIYVESTPSGSRVIELPVTEDGDFTERWPEGFFTERAEELF